MKVSMGFLEVMLRSLHPAARQADQDWEAFNLEGWTLNRQNGALLRLTDISGLETLPPLPGERILCAGTPELWPENGSFLCFDCSLPELIEAVNRLFSWLQTVEAGIFHALYAQQSVADVVEQTGPLLGGRVLALSADLRVLAEWNGGSAGPTDTELIAALAEDPAFARRRQEREPFLLEKGILPLDCVCANVFHQHVPVCRIIHIAEDGKYLPCRLHLLRMTAEYIQAAYEQPAGKAGPELRDRLWQLTRELLDGGSPRPEAVELALGFRGWPVNGPFVCAVILPTEGDLAGGALPYYFRAMSRMVSHSYVLEDQGEAVCIVWLQPYGGTIDGFMEKNVEFLRDSNLLAGFSQIFFDLRELAAARVQARVALRMGLRLRPTIWYHRFSELALPYILERITGELDAQHIAAPELLRLRRYDLENGTEYVRTLWAYLRSSLNAAGTAKQLYIHRGTMNYRLSRIREPTGLEPEDPDTRLYLELSFRLLELTE